MRIIIHSCSYELSEPYQSGPTILSEDEARALNSFRADRIRDVASKSFVQRGDIPSHPEYTESQAKITAYDKAYTSFKFQSLVRTAPIDQELYYIAMDRIEARLRKNQIALNPNDFEELLKLEIALPEVWEEARRRLLIKQTAIGSLEDLL